MPFRRALPRETRSLKSSRPARSVEECDDRPPGEQPPTTTHDLPA